MIKYYNIIVFILCCIFVTISIEYRNEQIKEQELIINELKYKVDSLSNELFPINIELTRYQTAFDLFYERNPEAAQEYMDIISNETE